MTQSDPNLPASPNQEKSSTTANGPGQAGSAAQNLAPGNIPTTGTVLGNLAGNREGRVQALTVMTPVRPFWVMWLWILFWLIRRFPALTGPLRQLSFIHYARWNIVTGIPYNGGAQKPEKLHYKYLLFTSNFNGSWDQYIDAFAYTVAKQMRQIWGSSYGFPGPFPVQPFKDYIRANEYVCNHYYSAYPDSSTTMILQSLELEKRFRSFASSALDLGPEEFKAAYNAFLTGSQKLV